MRTLIVMVSLGLFVAPALGQSTATITQSGDDNSTSAVQTGANTATVTQTAGLKRNGDPTGGHDAVIEQVGSGVLNEIALVQTYGTNTNGPQGSHSANLYQNGGGNEIAGRQDSRSHLSADVDQIGNDNYAEFNNGNITQYQEGDGNTAISTGGNPVVQEQIGDGNWAKNAGNDAEQYQYGNDNTAFSKAWVSGSPTYQYQEGDRNRSAFRRLRHGGHTAWSQQIGNDNVVDGHWHENRANVLIATQTGDLNSATVDFQSAGNTALITQTGNENSAVTLQN